MHRNSEGHSRFPVLAEDGGHDASGKERDDGLLMGRTKN
jgi:hypothetical protein